MINRLIANGNHATALQQSRALSTELPDADRPYRLLVRSMLMAPLTDDLAAEALHALQSIAADSEPRHVGLARRVAIASTHTASAEHAARYFEHVFASSDDAATHHLTEVAVALQSAGHQLLATELVTPAVQAGRIPLDRLDELALLARDESLASMIDQSFSDRSSQARTLFASHSLEIEGAIAEAFMALREVPEHPSSVFSLRYAALAKRVGRYDELLHYLDSVPHQLGGLDEARLRFDCFFALGQRAEAEAALTSIPAEHHFTTGYLTRLEAAFGQAAIEEKLATVTGLDTQSRLSVAWAHMLTNNAQKAIELLAAGDGLPPAGRMTLARAFYCERRFDEAEALLPGLFGTPQQVPSEQLKARILLERGRFAEALENRMQAPIPSDFDLVRYNSLLALGHYDRAFSVHPWPPMLSELQAVFGDRAEEAPEEMVSTRFVMSEGGPGDEIRTSTLYAALATRAERTYITAEPRLLSLLQRSFPTITFVPSERLRPDQFGSVAAGRPERAPNRFFDLLTQEALAIAATCERVVSGKAIQRLAADKSISLPSSPHLVPLPTPPSRRLRPRVGLVWRSEIQSSWRNIHYLETRRVAELLDLDADFVCLQHDVKSHEIQILNDAAGSIEILHDVDLRDDFEASSVLVRDLDIVVGIGTTILHLAAAVGTEVLMLQPTHFGTWRKGSGPEADADFAPDFWYEKATIVTAPQPYDQKELLARAKAELSRRIGLRASGPIHD